MQNHHNPIKLPYGENTIAYSTFAPPSKLVIFIHGFNGNSIKTWDEFPELVQTHKKFEDADVIFYGYNSLKGQIENMKLDFYKFLERTNDPSMMPYRKLSPQLSYSKIVIVAHSLGAVVTRLALLYAYDKKVTWLNKCRMVLYAPAHWGSRVLDNFKDCFTGIGRFFQSLTITNHPVISDLAEGSLVLNNLINQTSKVLAKEQASFVMADAVIWAKNEKIVINTRFCSDNPEDDIDGTVHTSVCKPDYQFLAPFDALLPYI